MNIKKLLKENKVEFRDYMEHGSMWYSFRCRYCTDPVAGANLFVLNGGTGEGSCATCKTHKVLDELIADYEWKVPVDLFWESGPPQIKNLEELKILGVGEIMSTQFGPQQWVVDRLVPCEAITMLSGDPENGKTWLAMEMARCVATEQPFLGRFKTKKGSVLVIDEEDGLRFIKDRLKVLGVPNSAPIYYLSQAGVKLDNDKWFEAIKEEVKNSGYTLVIIDSLIRVHSKNENDAGDMSSVFERLRELTKFGAGVLVTHHHRKSGEGSQKMSDKLRGSSDIFASLDCHLTVEMDDDSITMRQNKMRVAAKLKPFQIAVTRTDDCPSGFTYSGETEEKVLKKDQVKAIILEALKDGQKDRAQLAKFIRATVRIGENAIGDALNELVENGLVEVTTGLKNKKTYSLPTA